MSTDMVSAEGHEVCCSGQNGGVEEVMCADVMLYSHDGVWF